MTQKILIGIFSMLSLESVIALFPGRAIAKPPESKFVLTWIIHEGILEKGEREPETRCSSFFQRILPATKNQGFQPLPKLEPIFKLLSENIAYDDKLELSAFAGRKTSNVDSGFQASISKT